MAEGDDDKDQKSHDPTQKKLDDALKKGDVVKSQDLISWFILATGALLIATAAAGSVASLSAPLKGVLANLDQVVVDREGIGGLLWAMTLATVGAIGLPLAALFLAGVAGNMIQHRMVFSAESLKPRLSKLSPMAGFKRVFGKEAAVNFLKGVAKLAIIGTVMFAVLWPQRALIDSLVRMEVAGLLFETQTLIVQILMAAVAALLVVAAADYFYQYVTWYGRQRMSLQDMKEEFKQSEGNPEVKGKLRQVRRERSRKRMMANVPKATVVITNPTHFAVALRYESGMAAPVCVAKGVDDVAKRIRDLATEHDVPLVENPPLARALHAAIEVDDMIPEEHFRAVAEIVGYVMQLKKRGR